jgi:hypothetical protein
MGKDGCPLIGPTGDNVVIRHLFRIEDIYPSFYYQRFYRMSATDRSASGSTYMRRYRALASYYKLNPGAKKAMYSGAGGQENSGKVAGILVKPCCPPPAPPAPIFYTVVYNGNGSTGGSVPVDPASPYLAGSSVTVLGNTGGLIRMSFVFRGWNTKADGSGISYNGSDIFIVSENTILYAQWGLE